MKAERDELTLRIFPSLRKICEERGIAWGEVDLRGGIPEEKSERGETLQICLDYIEKCRPYFIGMLGERYVCHISISKCLCDGFFSLS